MFKMGSHYPFGYLKHELYSKEGSGDTPPNSLMDSTASPKVKTTKVEGIGAHSLARSTLGVKGCTGAPGWD
jgi:hypothetical protein